MNDWKQHGEMIYREANETRLQFVSRIKDMASDLEVLNNWVSCYRWFGDAATIFVWSDQYGSPIDERDTHPKQEAGWYPDPHGAYPQRYWDGTEWTHWVYTQERNVKEDWR